MRRKSKLSSLEVKNYEKNRDDFMEKLQDFHQAKGNLLGKAPSFGGQTLDLYALYNTVTSFGGISVVTDKKKWGQVFTTLGFPPCTNAAFALRQHYQRYLAAYEKIFFLVEDDDGIDNSLPLKTTSQMLKYRRSNKAPPIGCLGEPLLENFNRISYSLQSGLQNEVNFALNICSLLSNVTNSIFNLAKGSSILDMILAHIAVWSKGDTITPKLYKEWYKGASSSNFVKFWFKTIHHKIAKEMYIDIVTGSFDSCDTYMDERDTKLLRNENDYDLSKNAQYSRVNQVTLILYNFSFEQINAMFIALHDGALRFLLLASCCEFSTISRSALETLDNIAEHIILKDSEDTYIQQFMQVLHDWLTCSDRFKRGRVMSIIGKLASRNENINVLSQSLSKESYDQLIKTLSLPDISLILSSMDALYTLSDLCETTATAIALVHGGISTLVCLVNIRAESYGNDAIKGYRIIENKNSIFSSKHQNLLKAQEAHKNQLIANQPMFNPPHPFHQNNPGYPRFPLMQYSQYHEPYHYQHPGHRQMHPHSQIPLRRQYNYRQSNVFSQESHGSQMQVNSPHYTQNPQLKYGQNYPYPPPRQALPDTPLPSQEQRELPPKPTSQLPSHVQSSHQLDQQDKQSPQPTQAESENSSDNQPPLMPIRPIPKLPSRGQHSQPTQQQQQEQQQQEQSIQLDTVDSELVELDPDIFTAHWISAYYEPFSQSEVKLHFIYEDYTNTCREMSRDNVLLIDQFAALLRSVLPSDSTKLSISLDEKDVITGIKRREKPIKIQNKVPKILHEQLIKNKPTLANKPSEKDSQKIFDLDTKLENNQKLSVDSENEISKDEPKVPASFDPTTIPHYKHILLNRNLDNKCDCLEIIEQIKVESQMHFMQFHQHRQFIQQVQVQLQQLMSRYQNADHLPPNMMNDIQVRVQNHHNQMQYHYGNLQSLSILSEHVQKKMKQHNGEILPKDLLQSQVKCNSSAFHNVNPKIADNVPLNTLDCANPLNSGQSALTPSPLSRMHPDIGRSSRFVSPSGLNIPPVPRSGRGSRGGKSRTRGVNFGLKGKRSRKEKPNNVSVTSNYAYNTTSSGGNTLFNHCENSPFVTGGGSIPNHFPTPFYNNHSPHQDFRNGSVDIQSPRISHNFTSNRSPGVSTNPYNQRELNGTVDKFKGNEKTTLMDSNHISTIQSSNSNAVSFEKNNREQNRKLVCAENNITELEKDHVVLKSVFENDKGKPLQIGTAKEASVDNPSKCSEGSLSEASIVMNVKHSDSSTNLGNVSPKPISNSPCNGHVDRVIDLNRSLDLSLSLQYDKNHPKKFSNGNYNLTESNSKNNHLLDSNNHTSNTVHSISENQNSKESFNNSHIINTDRLISNSNFKRFNGAFYNSENCKYIDTKYESMKNIDSNLKYSKMNGHREDDIMDGLSPLMKHPGDKSFEEPLRKKLKEDTCNISKEQPSNNHVPLLDNVKELDETSIHETSLNSKCKDSKNEIPNNEKNYTIQTTSNKNNNISSNSCFSNTSTSVAASTTSFNHERSEIKANSKIATLTMNSYVGENVNKYRIVSPLEELEKLEKSILNKSSDLGKILLKSPLESTPEQYQKKISPFEINKSTASEAVMKHSVTVCAALENKHVDYKTLPLKIIEGNHDEKQSINSDTCKESCKDKAQSSNIGMKDIEIDFVKEEVSSLESNNLISKEEANVHKNKILPKVNGLRLDLLKSNYELISPTSINSKSNENPIQLKDVVADQVMLMESKVNNKVFKNEKKNGKTNTLQVFHCSWSSCNLPHFKTASKLLSHMIHSHTPLDGKMITCKVKNCKSAPMMKGTMIKHFQEIHCTYLNKEGVRSVVPFTDKLFQKPDVPPPPSEEESPVTRSVRFTAALIVRNIAIKSPYGKSIIKSYEEKLAHVAMSKTEAASVIADCLAELQKDDDIDEPEKIVDGTFSSNNIDLMEVDSTQEINSDSFF